MFEKKNFIINFKIIKNLKKKNGKNFQGKITSNHKGGGNKKLYRIIDFKRENIIGKVINIQYDPNKSYFIALMLNIFLKKYYYIIAPYDLKINSILFSYNIYSINYINEYKIGYCMPLYNIPLRWPIHNIEFYFNNNGIFIRSAGNFALIIQKDNNINGFAYIKFKNKNLKKILLKCRATLGIISNTFHKFFFYKKAGLNRNKNKRPVVRGVAMNPIDHPHGGGEGKTSGGKISVTPWGKLTKGKKTVKIKKHEKIL